MRIYIGGRIGTIHLAPDKFTIRQKNEIAHSLKPITKEQALNDFEKLKNVNLNEVAGGSKIGNKVVDYFTYPERLTTQGHKGLSYYDVLSNTKEYLKKPHIAKVEKYIKAHNINVTHYQLWKEIFQVYFSSINIFKPLIAMEFYTKYKPKSVLDFTMGWGGRLVGACALNVPHYIGIDLNPHLEKPYDDMVKFLKPLTTTKITLFFKDALKVDYSKLNYDMVFTSPPYYNKEIYKGNKVLTKDEWDEQFYIPVFTMTYKYMQKGGHYCLNVPPEVYERVCIKLFGKAELVPFNKSVRERGGGKKYKEFIYVWHK